MPYSIMLDAGHGGRDPGAVYKERKEKDDTLRLTLAVGEILEAHGLDVQYTRTTDVYESPYQKAMEANNAGVLKGRPCADTSDRKHHCRWYRGKASG